MKRIRRGTQGIIGATWVNAITNMILKALWSVKQKRSGLWMAQKWMELAPYKHCGAVHVPFSSTQCVGLLNASLARLSTIIDSLLPRKPRPGPHTAPGTTLTGISSRRHGTGMYTSLSRPIFETKRHLKYRYSRQDVGLFFPITIAGLSTDSVHNLHNLYPLLQ